MNSSFGSRVIIVDNRDGGIKYSPRGWDDTHDNFGSADLSVLIASSYRHSLELTQANSSFSYGFEGTAISVIGGMLRSTDSGFFSWTCAVDGKPIDVSAEVIIDMGVLCSAQGLAESRNVLTVNVTSERSPFWMDSIQYVPSKNSPALESGVMLIDNTDPDIEYGGGWKEAATAKPIHKATSTNMPGSTVSFIFTGKGISWVSTMSTEKDFESRFVPSTGMYTIDDEEPVSFSFAAVVPPNDPRNQVLFETPELKPGKHTLKVTYIGNVTLQSEKSNSSLKPVDLPLDYLLVTNAPVPSSTPSETSQLPPKRTDLGTQGHGGNKLEVATVAGIIGGVVSLCLFLGIGFVFWRRKSPHRYPAENLAPSMYNDTPPDDDVEPFPVPSAMREAPPLRKWDRITGKLLARELTASRANSSLASSNDALYSTTNTSSATPSADLRSGLENRVSQPVWHEDSGIRLHGDVLEVPPEYTEN